MPNANSSGSIHVAATIATERRRRQLLYATPDAAMHEIRSAAEFNLWAAAAFHASRSNDTASGSAMAEKGENNLSRQFVMRSAATEAQWQYPSVRGSCCNIQPPGHDGVAVAKTRTRGKEAITLSTIRGLGKFDFLGRVFMSFKTYFRMQWPIV